MHPRISYYTNLIGCLFFAFSLVAIWWFDSHYPMSSLSNTDFLALFYVAGHLARTGNGAGLYPEFPHYNGSANFNFEPYVHSQLNVLAHQLLPDLASSTVPIFLYPPTVSIVFIPFTYLEPRLSLVAWQLISLAAVGVSSFLYMRYIRASRSVVCTFFAAFTLLPVLHTIIWGQPTIVVGLLPMTAGYVLWQRNKRFWAGFCWSLLFLKLQLLVPLGTIFVGLMLAGLFSRNSKRQTTSELVHLVSGMFIGLASLTAFTAIVLNGIAFSRWIETVTNFWGAYIGRAIYCNYLTRGSLLGVWGQLIDARWVNDYLSAAKILSVVFMVALAVMLGRIFASKSDWQEKKRLAIILVVGALPLVSTYLRIYDMCLLILPLWILLNEPLPPTVFRRLLVFLVVSGIGLDLLFLTQYFPVLLAALSSMVIAYLWMCQCLIAAEHV